MTTANLSRALNPSSLTHVHLLAALRGELRRTSQRSVIRILDAGCGDGSLIGYLHESLAALEPLSQVEIYGFDVSDPGVQKSDFFEKGVLRLEKNAAEIDWRSRLRSAAVAEAWPFESYFFDIVVSNQVLEHVADHGRFFGEMNRVLRADGIGLHCFPVRECLWEGHLHMPIVHRIACHDERKRFIALFSRMGLGKFVEHRRTSGISLRDFAERHADFLNLYTNYVRARHVLHVAKAAGLRASFAYTAGLYAQKLRRVLRRPLRLQYAAYDANLLRMPAFAFLKYLSSITLRVEKADAYRGQYSRRSAE